MVWEAVTTAEGVPPAPRHAHTATCVPGLIGLDSKEAALAAEEGAVGRSVVFFGGRDSEALFNDVHVLHVYESEADDDDDDDDVRSQRLVWVQPRCAGFPPSPRYRHASSFVRAGTHGPARLFVCGGHNGRRRLADVHCLDLDATPISWSAVKCAGRVPNPGRLLSCASDNSGRIFFFGGAQAGARASMQPVVLDCGDGVAWSCPAFEGTAPATRSLHTVNVIEADTRRRGNGRGERCLAIFGGYNGNTRFRDLHLLSLSSNTWFRTISSTSPRSARRERAAKMLRGDAEADDMASDRTALRVEGVPPAGRSKHLAVAAGNYLLVMGGYSVKPLHDLHVFDAAALTWYPLLPGGSRGGGGGASHSPPAVSPLAREGQTATRVGKHVFVFGGWAWPHAHNTLSVLHLGTAISLAIGSEAGRLFRADTSTLPALPARPWPQQLSGTLEEVGAAGRADDERDAAATRQSKGNALFNGREKKRGKRMTQRPFQKTDDGSGGGGDDDDEDKEQTDEEVPIPSPRPIATTSTVGKHRIRAPLGKRAGDEHGRRNDSMRAGKMSSREIWAKSLGLGLKLKRRRRSRPGPDGQPRHTSRERAAPAAGGGSKERLRGASQDESMRNRGGRSSAVEMMRKDTAGLHSAGAENGRGGREEGVSVGRVEKEDDLPIKVAIGKATGADLGSSKGGMHGVWSSDDDDDDDEGDSIAFARALGAAHRQQQRRQRDLQGKGGGEQAGRRQRVHVQDARSMNGDTGGTERKSRIENEGGQQRGGHSISRRQIVQQAREHRDIRAAHVQEKLQQHRQLRQPQPSHEGAATSDRGKSSSKDQDGQAAQEMGTRGQKVLGSGGQTSRRKGIEDLDFLPAADVRSSPGSDGLQSSAAAPAVVPATSPYPHARSHAHLRLHQGQISASQSTAESTKSAKLSYWRGGSSAAQPKVKLAVNTANGTGNGVSAATSRHGDRGRSRTHTKLSTLGRRGEEVSVSDGKLVATRTAALRVQRRRRRRPGDVFEFMASAGLKTDSEDGADTVDSPARDSATNRDLVEEGDSPTPGPIEWADGAGREAKQIYPKESGVVRREEGFDDEEEEHQVLPDAWRKRRGPAAARGGQARARGRGRGQSQGRGRGRRGSSGRGRGRGRDWRLAQARAQARAMQEEQELVIQDLETQTEKQEKVVAAVNDRLAHVTDELASLRDNLRVQKLKREGSEKALRKLVVHASDLSARGEADTRRQAQAQARAEALTAAIVEIERESVVNAQAAEEHKREAQALMSAVSSLNADIARQAADTEVASSEAAALRSSVDCMEDEVRSKQASLVNLGTESDLLRARLNELQRTIQTRNVERKSPRRSKPSPKQERNSKDRATRKLGESRDSATTKPASRGTSPTSTSTSTHKPRKTKTERPSVSTALLSVAPSNDTGSMHNKRRGSRSPTQLAAEASAGKMKTRATRKEKVSPRNFFEGENVKLGFGELLKRQMQSMEGQGTRNKGGQGTASGGKGRKSRGKKGRRKGKRSPGGNGARDVRSKTVALREAASPTASTFQSDDGNLSSTSLSLYALDSDESAIILSGGDMIGASEYTIGSSLGGEANSNTRGEDEDPMMDSAASAELADVGRATLFRALSDESTSQHNHSIISINSS